MRQWEAGREKNSTILRNCLRIVKTGIYKAISVFKMVNVELAFNLWYTLGEHCPLIFLMNGENIYIP